MSFSPRASVLLVALSFPGAAHATGAPPGASSCSGCHAASAGVDTPVTRLNGRPAADISGAMRDYREGKLPNTIMGRVAKGFTDGEIDAIATWYAGLKN